MKKLIIDIETIPNQTIDPELKPKFDETTVKLGNIKDPLKVEEKILEARKQFEEGLTKKMSVESNFCQILSLGYIELDGAEKVINQGVIIEPKKEVLILDCFSKIYQGQTIIGWNCKNFDIPIIWKRSVLLNLKPIFSDYRKLCNPYHDNGCIDLMHVWNGSGQYGKLIECAGLLGIKAKEGMDGSMIYDAFKENKLTEIAEYNKQDCETTFKIYRRLF